MTHWLYWRRIGTLVAAGVALAYVLGRLTMPDAGMERGRRVSSVFSPVVVTSLTEDNLVDAMTTLPLGERLSRVGWDHAILTVDLNISAKTAPEDVWRDVVRLIRYAFAEVKGVHQLLVRVYASDGETHSLLVSAETRPSDWTTEQLAAMRAPAGYPDEFFRARAHLAIYPQGERWLRNFAN